MIPKLYVPVNTPPLADLAPYPNSAGSYIRVGGEWVPVSTVPIGLARWHQPLTRTQVRRLFAQEERVALDNGVTTPALEGGDILLLKTLQNDLSQANEIRLDDPEFVVGIWWAVSKNFLTSQRAAEVLDGETPES